MTQMIDKVKELVRECIKENKQSKTRTFDRPANMTDYTAWPKRKGPGRPKTAPTQSPYQGYIDRLLKAIAGDDMRNAAGGHAEEEGDLVVFRLQFKLMNQLALEKLLKFTENHLGQVRIYPEQHSIVVELRLKKQKAV